MSDVLIVRLKELGKNTRILKYDNQVNSQDFKQVALVLFDLSNNGISIDKAITEYRRMKESGTGFPW